MLFTRLIIILTLVVGCSGPDAATDAATRRAAAAADGNFAEVQGRGEIAMGVDQYTSTHIFRPLPDGGRIELQRDAPDSVGRARILEHMTAIAVAFSSGNFAVPGFVHGRQVPGTGVMAARRAEINYVVESLPRGAAVRLSTGNRSAVEAIHAFLAFQRRDHRAGEHHEE